MLQKAKLLKFINLWPPYMGSGIRVKRISKDFRAIDVELKLQFWNRNYVGTHFGGSLYSMTDPFFMLMLIENLGRNYIVWDKAATIRFRKPGRGIVRAEFRLGDEELEKIRAQCESEYKSESVFRVNVCNQAGEIVAEVEKVLYVKRKEAVKT